MELQRRLGRMNFDVYPCRSQRQLFVEILSVLIIFFIYPSEFAACVTYTRAGFDCAVGTLGRDGVSERPKLSAISVGL